jgi:hypothetical protein
MLLEDIRDLYEKGYKYKEITEKLNIPYGTLLVCITILHKYYGMKHRLSRNINVIEFIKNYIITNKVVTRSQLLNASKEAGYNVKTIESRLVDYIRRLNSGGINIGLINLRRFRRYIKPEFRTFDTIYYTDLDLLIEYLAKIIQVEDNKRRFTYLIRRLNLPENYVNKLIKLVVPNEMS